ncbi:hypothetical protein [Kutzneria buriramensis]|uniref:Cellulose biosynthesis protein BcsQ n=1 Tax=Kutzneria buriramensis TaxID=1045776 RepID=A0A3E0GWY8_9PSEU|nr:hypothetical protein [Kutzneria buriramensis]REH28635.1 cellulose biosynthesis protein BcsQ [Kutzneria buriramensis]
MAIITIVSAKAAPGATSAAVALAVTWPAPVLLVGADPAGDDIIGGYLGPWIAKGWVHPAKGIVSFATATRHVEPDQACDLAAHTQLLPGGRNARVLLGLSDPAQIMGVGPAGWQRLARSLAASAGAGCASDAIVDCGRFGLATPRALLQVADLVLVAVRPQRRSVLATRPLIRLLQQQFQPQRLGVAVVAATPEQADEVVEVLKVPAGVHLPDDVVTARAFSDGATPLPRRSALTRTATAAGTRLHHVLNQPQLPQPRLVGARS